MSSKFSQNSQKNTYHGALLLQAWVADCKSERYQKRSPIHALYCPAGIYLLKVNNRNTSQWRRSGIFIVNFEWRRSGIFIVNFEFISHLVLVFLLLTLNM